MSLNIGELVGYLQLDDSRFDQGLNSAEGKLSGFGGRAAAAGGVIGTGIAAALGAGFVAAVDVEAANAKVSAQLRLTEEESARVGEVAGGLYSSAYGDNMGHVNEAVRGLIVQMGDLGDISDEELSRAGAKALDLATIMGEDVTRVTQIAGQAVRNGLAKDIDEAFDLIAAASAKTMPGLEGDLLDAADEYGQFFSALGIDGPRAFGLLATASQQGMYGIDKTGDAVKEFTIRATDMSATSVAAYEAIGLNAEEMSDKVLAGGATASGAFDQIVKGLLAIESPSARANTAIALFGTPLEDLSVSEIPRFLESLIATESSLTDVAGAATEMGNTLNDTAQARITAFGRTLKTKLVDFIGGEAIPAVMRLASSVADHVGPVFADAREWVGNLWEAFTEGEGVLGVAGDLLMGAGEGVQFLVQQIGPAVEIVGDLVGWLADLPAPVQAAGLAFLALSLARPQITSLGTAVKDNLGGAVRGIRDGLDAAALRTMYFGDAAKGAANGGVASLASAIGRSAGAGLRSAASGLLTVMGGPLGVAIAGVSLALGFLAQKHMEAKQAAAEQEAAAETLGATLDQRTGAITRETEALVAKAAAESGALDAARELGVATSDVTAAALGNIDAQERISEAVQQAQEAALGAGNIWDTYAAQLTSAGLSMADVTAAADGNAQAQMAVLGAIQSGAGSWEEFGTLLSGTSGQVELLTTFVDAQRDAIEEQASAILDASGAMSDADPKVQTLTDSMSVLSDETASADTKARALNDALTVLSGGTFTLEEAQGRANEAVRRVEEAFVAATEAAGGNTAALFTSSGAIDTTTDAGWRLWQAVTDATGAMASEAQAARDLAIANGSDAAGGLDAARLASQRVRDSFVATATQALGSKEAAEALADAYGLIPDDVVTVLDASDKATPVVQGAQGELNAFDGRRARAEAGIDVTGIGQAERELASVARPRTVWFYPKMSGSIPKPAGAAQSSGLAMQSGASPFAGADIPVATLTAPSAMAAPAESVTAVLDDRDRELLRDLAALMEATSRRPAQLVTRDGRAAFDIVDDALRTGGDLGAQLPAPWGRK
ncbi:MAG TPA: phage tail tape measure protein [Pseudonocardia sp.]